MRYQGNKNSNEKLNANNGWCKKCITPTQGYDENIMRRIACETTSRKILLSKNYPKSIKVHRNYWGMKRILSETSQPAQVYLSLNSQMRLDEVFYWANVILPRAAVILPRAAKTSIALPQISSLETLLPGESINERVSHEDAVLSWVFWWGGGGFVGLKENIIKII